MQGAGPPDAFLEATPTRDAPPVGVSRVGNARPAPCSLVTAKSSRMHRNPVLRGLVLEAQQWPWSSFRHYAYDEPGAVLVNELQKAELRIRKVT